MTADVRLRADPAFRNVPRGLGRLAGKPNLGRPSPAHRYEARAKTAPPERASSLLRHGRPPGDKPIRHLIDPPACRIEPDVILHLVPEELADLSSARTIADSLKKFCATTGSARHPDGTDRAGRRSCALRPAGCSRAISSPCRRDSCRLDPRRGVAAQRLRSRHRAERRHERHRGNLRLYGHDVRPDDIGTGIAGAPVQLYGRRKGTTSWVLLGTATSTTSTGAVG